MKTWFITGISRGLGRSLAQAALHRGDTVIGTVREGTAEIDHHNGTLHTLTLEVRDARAIDTAVADAFALAGRIDVVVNNAGYGLLGPLESASDDDLARLFDVDLFGPMRIIRAVLPYLRAQGSGHIINVTSIAGRAPTAGSAAYAAAKSAMEGLSASLQQEVAPFGIKVTAVAPGAFRTDFLSDHSIRRATTGSDAYAASVGTSLARLDKMAGSQIGDPARAALAMLAAVDAPNPPLHLLLGTDALRRAREKLDAMIEEIEHWEAVTRGTDYES